MEMKTIFKASFDIREARNLTFKICKDYELAVRASYGLTPWGKKNLAGVNILINNTDSKRCEYERHCVSSSNFTIAPEMTRIYNISVELQDDYTVDLIVKRRYGN